MVKSNCPGLRARSARPVHARRREFVWTASASTAGGFATLATLLFFGGAVSDVTLSYTLIGGVTGVSPMAPLSAVNASAGGGACASNATGTVPFGNGSAAANATVVEPRGCPSATQLVFLPPVELTNGLPVTAGHSAQIRLDIVTINGTTAMLTDVRFYIQEVGGGNPIVTGTSANITNGSIATMSTSNATLVALNTYGVGFLMNLTRPFLSGAATVNLTLTVYLFDGGAVEALSQELVTFLVFY
ncbi:MAG: hypothetical protein L3K09_02610 [Thermoplasmata archaeon]|nr:hypothetical protein [Thermoplasmata archaeon]